MTDAGAFCIFKRATPPSFAYSQVQFIQASDKQRNAQFGYTVAINSNANYIVASTPFVNKTSGVVLTDCGSLYIYKKNPIIDFWNVLYQFRPSDNVAFDQFGYSISMTPDAQYLVSSSPQRDVDTPLGLVANAGSVYIYKKSPTTDFWDYLQTVSMISPVSGALMGYSVEISDDGMYIFAGTEGSRGGISNDRMTCVFKKDLFTDYWTEVTRLCAFSSIAGTGQTFSISSNATYFLQNTAIAVSQYSSFMYKKDVNTDVWTLIQTIPQTERLTTSKISSDGSNILVGISLGNNGAGANSGYVNFYKKRTTTDYWDFANTIVSSRTQASASFGNQVAFVADDSIALCAASGQSSITGAGTVDAGIVWAFGFASSKEFPSTSQFVLSTPPVTGRIDFTLPRASSTRYPILYYKSSPAYSGQQALRFQTQAGETIDGGGSILGYSYHASYSFANDGVSKWYTLMSYGESS